MALVLTQPDTLTFSRLEWEPSVSYGRCSLKPEKTSTDICSSARDQLTNQNVAVKKIMKPFSTPVLAKRTYRELKLLKHLRHENVTHPSDLINSAN